MLYKFKSKAGGDVIMLASHGAQVLGWLGRDPAQPGIVEHADMAQAIAKIKSALDAEEDLQRQRAEESEASLESVESKDVSMRSRCWPLLALMEQSLAARADLVWGV